MQSLEETLGTQNSKPAWYPYAGPFSPVTMDTELGIAPRMRGVAGWSSVLNVITTMMCPARSLCPMPLN